MHGNFGRKTCFYYFQIEQDIYTSFSNLCCKYMHSFISHLDYSNEESLLRHASNSVLMTFIDLTRIKAFHGQMFKTKRQFGHTLLIGFYLLLQATKMI